LLTPIARVCFKRLKQAERERGGALVEVRHCEKVTESQLDQGDSLRHDRP
jgi:hypothetical protein